MKNNDYICKKYKMPQLNKIRPYWLPKPKPFASVEGEWSTLYNTNRWRTLRKTVLKREPLCRRCNEKGLIVTATDLDHIVPEREGGSFWDSTNMQPLCKECHKKKTFADMRRRKQANKNKET